MGSTIALKTGIKLHMPKYVDASPCRGVPRGVATTVFPRMVMHAHLDSIFELLVEKGLSVLGPRLMSAEEVNGKELVVYLQNLGKQEFVAKAGDEVATLYYTIMPISTMEMVVE
jgi:dUTPase